MGDTGVWHEVEHGKGEVIKVTTPTKFNIPLNQDLTLIAAVGQDLWHKVVGVYASLIRRNTSHHCGKRISRKTTTFLVAPQQLQLRETYKEGYLTDRWF